MRRLTQSLAIVAAVFGLFAVPAAVAAEPMPIEGTFYAAGESTRKASGSVRTLFIGLRRSSDSTRANRNSLAL
jgi:hypothetical protein